MGQNDSKDVEELRILETLYSPKEYRSEKCERPDFIVTELKNKNKFGVEITKLFKNESTARFISNSKYLLDIMNNKYWKKRDKQHLVRDIYTLEDLEGKQSFEFDGVLVNKPTLREYQEMINDRLLDKNQKIKGYNKELQYINLIIFDKEEDFYTLPIEVIINEILNDELIKTIKTTIYNEIFVVSVKGENKLVFPLKIILLISEMLKLKKYIYVDLKVGQQKNEFLFIFYRYLTRSGYNNVRIVQNRANLGIAIDNFVFISGYKVPIVRFCDIKADCKEIEMEIPKLIDEIDFNDFFDKTKKLIIGPGSIPLLL